jgi:hypothetical protein
MGMFENSAPMRPLQVFPNPFSESVSITWHGEAEASVFDYTGKLCFSQMVREGKNELLLNLLSPGIYLLVIKDKTSYSAVRVVKTR